MGTNLFSKFESRFELGQFYPSYERNLKAVVPEFAVPQVKESLVFDASCVTICYWCEGDAANAKKYAAECVKHAIDLFFGKWREEIPTGLKTLDAHWWRVHMTWMEPFASAMCWASARKDWKALEQLAKYPIKESKPDIGSGTKEGAAAYLALACFLRGDSPSAYEHCFGTIEKGGKQKPKFLAEVVRAFQAKDRVKVQQSLEAYFRFFQKREFKRNSISSLLALDGSTLLHIAEREGFKINVPPEVKDHIVRFQ